MYNHSLTQSNWYSSVFHSNLCQVLNMDTFSLITVIVYLPLAIKAEVCKVGIAKIPPENIFWQIPPPPPPDQADL